MDASAVKALKDPDSDPVRCWAFYLIISESFNWPIMSCNTNDFPLKWNLGIEQASCAVQKNWRNRRKESFSSFYRCLTSPKVIYLIGSLTENLLMASA